jgi:hypothetical protein
MSVDGLGQCVQPRNRLPPQELGRVVGRERAAPERTAGHDARRARAAGGFDRRRKVVRPDSRGQHEAESAVDQKAGCMRRQLPGDGELEPDEPCSQARCCGECPCGVVVRRARRPVGDPDGG